MSGRTLPADGATICEVAATVVIVDDHPSFRRMARRLLEDAGLAVVDEAGDGASALTAVQTRRPDVVLLDVLLPDTTGFELADTLAEGRHHPTVILTSSRSASDFGVAVVRSSVRGFIPKSDLSGPALLALVDGAP
jgi:DNA-binding NarL/FixJ family response regulator